tara:strand:- start:6042 stop:6326 length:285 start_codon:yes stop_codon:yes gene_type:complete
MNDEFNEYIFKEHDLMELGYNLVTGNFNYEELLYESNNVLIFPFDPTSIKKSDVLMLENYFASIDEFEKAIVLRDLDINNLNKCHENFKNSRYF